MFVHGWFDAYDMILSAMPTKLQNMQEALSYLEMLQHEVKVLESLKTNKSEPPAGMREARLCFRSISSVHFDS